MSEYRVRHTQRLPDWVMGVILIGLIAIGSFLAYTKELPWSSRYEVSAVFPSAQGLRPSSPVRIAGVNVGEVTKLEHETLGAPPEGAGPDDLQAVRVTMELNENARPIHEDATLKIRPRLFLEGNYFIDLAVGSPSAPEAADGHVFGLDQTAYSVQLDQVLTTLQSDVRRNLQVLLDQFGNALVRYGGAEGLQDLYRSSPVAYRYTAQVNEAQLGTHTGDLRGVIRGLGRVLRGLGRDEAALRDLVTNFRVVSGSFAAEHEALGRAIELLPDFLEAGEPAFQELNRALPALRAFAREALPGVRKSPEALRASLPMLQQLNALMSREELRGLVHRLRPTVPELARLAKGNVSLFEQTRAFSSCFNEVIIPWSHSSVEPVDPTDLYPFDPAGRVFETTGYAFTGSASESRSGDANGQHLRVLGGSGSNIVRYPESLGRDAVFGLTPFPILGAMPRINDSRKSVFRPDAPCERQEPPNLEGGIGAPPDQQPVPAGATGLEALAGPGADRFRALATQLASAEDVLTLIAAGEDRAAERLIARLQGFVDRLGLMEIDVAAALEAASE